MQVRFMLRSPGNHEVITQVEMESVPRIEEYVVINDVSRIVHSVSWDITENTVIVLLRE